MREVVIVGAGLAGLSAAWRLRHHDVVVLEAGNRIGGRIHSERRGDYYLNWGGHVFAGAPTAGTTLLLGETDVLPKPIPGVLTGLSMNGKLLLSNRVETYPLRVPMRWSTRFALAKAGVKVGAAVLQYARIVGLRPGEDEAARQQRVYDFMNDRSFADFVGELPPDAQALFEPTVSRSSADMDQISAGAGVGYFSLVFNIGAGLGNNVDGGPSHLTQTIADHLGGAVHLQASVTEVVQRSASVVVRYREAGVDHEVEARCAVLATPAPITRQIAVDLPAPVREALSRIVYGSYVSAAFLTNETTPQAWDRAYSIATPKRSFAVALNMTNAIRGDESERRPGSSLMVFSPARLARELLDRDDAEILATYTRDLDRVLPGVAQSITEAKVERFPLGAPYCFPGRARLQPTLTGGGGRILLAGDYLGTLYTETAIQTGFIAATRAGALLQEPDATWIDPAHRSAS